MNSCLTEQIEPERARGRKLLMKNYDIWLFTPNIKKALSKTLLNPAATANGETKLLLVLRKYDPVKKTGMTFVAHIEEGALFESLKGRVFKRGKKRRIRIECIEVSTGHVYSFSALTEVMVIHT